MFAVKTRAFLLGRGGTRGAGGEVSRGGILYTEHTPRYIASQSAFDARLETPLLGKGNLGKRLSTDFARTCSRQLFDRSSSVLFQLSVSVSPRDENKTSRGSDRWPYSCLSTPFLSVYRICLSPLRETVETDDGITIEGSRMILEVFRGGEGEVVEFRLTLDDR